MSVAEQRDQRGLLRALIVMTSAYYGQKLEDAVVEMYAEDLADLPFEAVRAALQELRRDPKQRTFPLPAVIRDRISPFDSAEMDAKDAASRIVGAVARFGWNNSAIAKEAIGELAWAVVERQGGWENVCRVLNEDNMGQMQAQWRDIAFSLARRARLGLSSVPPRLTAVSGFSALMHSMPGEEVQPANEEEQRAKLQKQLEDLRRQEEQEGDR